MQSFLGLDIGTKRIKSFIVDVDGEIRSHSFLDIYDLTERPQPSWAQRDANKLWKYVKKNLSKLDGLDEIAGICVDATSGTIVPIDGNGNPAYRELMYSDERATKEAEELRRKSRKALEFERFLPIAPYLVLPKIMWLKKNTDFKKVHRILHESDFIVFKLTDKSVTSPNTAGKSHADLQNSRYVEEIYEDVHVNLDLMPLIKPIGEAVGSITEDASNETGIPAGVPVINGMTDASASDVATGTLKPGQANINIGTTLTLHAVVKDAVPDPAKRFYYKAYFEHNYLAGLATNAGTLPLDALGKLLKKPLRELEQEAGKIRVGCDGLIAQPEWTGIRSISNYPNMRGFFINVDERNFTPGHLCRSILEGNALVCSRLLTIIEKVTGTDLYEVRTCGGGARSQIQNQMIADASCRTIKKMKTEEAAIGSAIIAIYGTHKTLPISEIASRIVKVEYEHTPDLPVRKEYDAIGKKLERITRLIGKVLE